MLSSAKNWFFSAPISRKRSRKEVVFEEAPKPDSTKEFGFMNLFQTAVRLSGNDG
jgi:hypothetical protein